MEAKFVILIPILIAILTNNGSLANDCNCSAGYMARNEDGQLSCVNLRNGKIRQCIPMPHCQCMENAVKVRWGINGIVCAYGFANRMKIWPCENKEDWKNFRNKLKEKV